MTIEYKWKIKKVELEDIDNLNNVVVTIDWQVRGVDSVDGENASYFGSTSLKAPDGESYTSVENLTDEQVVSWIRQAMVVESEHNKEEDGESSTIETFDRFSLVEESLTKSIQLKREKKQKISTPPWQK